MRSCTQVTLHKPSFVRNTGKIKAKENQKKNKEDAKAGRMWIGQGCQRLIVCPRG
jgi:hypothetical protein